MVKGQGLWACLQVFEIEEGRRGAEGHDVEASAHCEYEEEKIDFTEGIRRNPSKNAFLRASPPTCEHEE